MIKFQGCY